MFTFKHVLPVGLLSLLVSACAVQPAETTEETAEQAEALTFCPPPTNATVSNSGAVTDVSFSGAICPAYVDFWTPYSNWLYYFESMPSWGAAPTNIVDCVNTYIHFKVYPIDLTTLQPTSTVVDDYQANGVWQTNGTCQLPGWPQSPTVYPPSYHAAGFRVITNAHKANNSQAPMTVRGRTAN